MLLLFFGLMIKCGFVFQIPFNFKRPSKPCQQYQINRPLVFFGSLFLDTCGHLPDFFFLLYLIAKTSLLTNVTFVFQMKSYFSFVLAKVLSQILIIKAYIAPIITNHLIYILLNSVCGPRSWECMRRAVPTCRLGEAEFKLVSFR